MALFCQTVAGIAQIRPDPGLSIQSSELIRVALRNFKCHADLQSDMGVIAGLMTLPISVRTIVRQVLNLLLRIGKLTSCRGARGGGVQFETSRSVVVVW